MNSFFCTLYSANNLFIIFTTTKRVEYFAEYIICDCEQFSMTDHIII